MNVKTTNPICVAIDSPDPEVVRTVASDVAPHVGAIKVGLTAFVANGPALVRDLASDNDVFLDLKLHDIPAQVEGAVRGLVDLGARLTTVHASGGRSMLEAAAAASGSDLKVIAVTVLTSMDEGDMWDIGMEGDASTAVLRLAELAMSAGADGLVCSPLEVAAIRERFGPHVSGGPYLVVPGIRPVGSSKDDQRRTLGPREALDAGADLLVIGRPITASSDPKSAAREIAASL